MRRGAGPLVKSRHACALITRSPSPARNRCSPGLLKSHDDASDISSDGRGGVLMNPSPDEPPLHPSELHRITRARSFVRFLIIFFIGITATLAWQSYGGAARKTMASWSPRLAWLAPPLTPAPSDQIVAISRDLAGVRQSVDKLATDITKLQARKQSALERTSSSPPSSAEVTVHKPSPQTR